MQPQMPHGAPQGGDPQSGPYYGPPQPGQPNPQGYPGQQPYGSPQPYQQPYPTQPGTGYPYQNAPGVQQSYPAQQGYPVPGAPIPNQQPMPQYQPPAGYGQPQQSKRPALLPPPPPVQKTPYDFFMQQKHPTNTKSLPSPRQAGFRGRLIWVAGGALAIMLIVVVISALTPKDTTGQQLLTIVQTQQEVARICAQGASKALSQSNRNLAINCSMSITSDQTTLLSYLAKNGIKIPAKQLGALANPNTDSKLNAAAASSNYDSVFTAVAIQQLSAYAGLMQQQLASGQLGTNAQAILNADIAHAKILIGTNK